MQIPEIKDYDEWLKRIELEKSREASRTETPSTTYFTIRKIDSKIIGTIQLRHHLTDELRKDGGNIGYGICPSERRKGYGTRQLALALLEAQKLNIPRVMITCDRSNRASAKVIINNGGVLLGEGFDEESKTITEIYWINIM
jgi:predicted acetyltransferase